MSQSIDEISFVADVCRITIGSRLFREQCELRINSQNVAFSFMSEQSDGILIHQEFICSIDDLWTVVYTYDADSEDSDSTDSDDEAPTKPIEALEYCMALRFSPTGRNNLLEFQDLGEYLPDVKFKQAQYKSRHFALGFCTFEFFTSPDLSRAIRAATTIPEVKPTKIAPSLISSFCKYLVEDSNQQNKHRLLQIKNINKSASSIIKYPFNLSIEEDINISKRYQYFHPDVEVNLRNICPTKSFLSSRVSTVSGDSHKRLVTYRTGFGYDFLDDDIVNFLLHR